MQRMSTNTEVIEHIRTLRLVRDQDGEVVGEVWRVERATATGKRRVYLRSLVHDQDEAKLLGVHLQVDGAVAEIREYWGMIR